MNEQAYLMWKRHDWDHRKAHAEWCSNVNECTFPKFIQMLSDAAVARGTVVATGVPVKRCH